MWGQRGGSFTRGPRVPLELAQVAWWGGWVFKRLVPPLPQQLALALGGVQSPGAGVGASFWGGHDPPGSSWH